ncbi:MAG TPA: ABC transporter substrate-binding protein [Bacteroidota bacterium]|nr:ABC transporter substrate-binding protein [Bacteroidota bacterium]
MNRLSLFVCAGLLLAPLCLRAQERLQFSANGEALFREAVARFDSGRFREAAVGFDRCITEYPSGHRITAAWVMKGKALARLGENLDAARTLRTFMARFPGSAYLPDAELTLGEIFVRVERPAEGMEMLLAAYRGLGTGSPPRLVQSVIAAMDSTVDTKLSRGGLEKLLAGAGTAQERAYLWLKIAEREAMAGNSAGASVALDSLDARYGAGALAGRAAAVRARVAVRGAVRLGVLVPLMKNGVPSGARAVGTEVAEGIAYALERYAEDPSHRVAVTLETRDTERDPRTAAAEVRALADDPAVVAVIGPVFSPEATAAAAVASAPHLPLVTPTANADGIAAAGPVVFQTNPDYAARGRAMARYAVTQRGYRTLAVLAPADTYAKYLADAFAREALRLGARIIATQWYQRGTSDLKPQLEAIRRAGMLEGADAKLSFAGKVKPATLMRYVQLGVPLKRIDSLMNRSAVVSARALLGPRARALLDSVDIPVVYDESRVDSLEYPVESIDAIYAPISGADEIGIVSSQVVYFHFQAQLLGSGEWNSFAELNANRRYADGLIFESDTYIDTAGGGYGAFADAFAARYRKRPTKNTLFGYDTAALVLGLIGGGAGTRETLAAALAGVHAYRGYHSRISMGSDRVNGALTVLKYAGDEIVRVADVDGSGGEGMHEGAPGR